MTISDDIILKAQEQLLPENCYFDIERIDFIKNFDSIDLLAVPGSGKTTALLAKLFCLSKQLPFKDGSGILVLSHTNAAINEIKKNLEAACPQLFRYPNMVATVQEFVDRFLTIPFYEHVFGRHILSIDSDDYNLAIDNYINSHRWSKPISYFINKDIENKVSKDVRLSYDINGNKILLNKIGGNPYRFNPPTKWIKEGTVDNNLASINRFLIKMKEHIIKTGILHFDDCYFLADAYIKNNPKIIDILQNRFKFVFVDEAQDLQLHQLNLIDRIFNTPSVVLQRIGDPNQSIYSKVSKDCLWNIRAPKYLKTTLRLSAPIAEVVNYFAINTGEQDTNGIPVFYAESETDRHIPPYMILYDEESVGNLKNCFSDLIQSHNLQNTIEGSKYGFHIIGWNARAKREGINKCHLEDLFTDYHHDRKKESYKPKTLLGYIELAKKHTSSIERYKTIIESLCVYFKLSGLLNSDNRPFSASTLEAKIKDTDELYIYFRSSIFNIVKHLNFNINTSHELLKDLLRNIAEKLEVTETDSANNFKISTEEQNAPVEQTDIESTNIDIIMGSVHSVKGMTHCATMYIETFYEGKFESQHIDKSGHNPLFKERYSLKGVYALEAMKMLYVGFSRPTHLLCYATQKHIWKNEDIEKMSSSGWKIIDLTSVEP